MSELYKLKQLQNTKEFAEYLGYTAQMLTYLLYSPDYKNKYVQFSIAKKSGGERNICAPDKKLLLLQKRLAAKLQQCYEEISCMFSKEPNFILTENIRSSIVHGFRKKLSIQSNALCHINGNILLNVDLKDFFPSINFGRVRGFFIKNSFFHLNEKVATLIAQIVCYNNELPQGAPTSPVIANLLATPMDVRILNLAKKNGVFYTRYADDLTFSTKLKIFPEDFLIVTETLEYSLGKKLKKIIQDSGFVINENKVRMHLKQSKQTVTGLVVNKKVNVDRKYYKLLRAQCHSLFTKGFYIDNGVKICREEYEKLKSLEGKLNFAFFTNNFCQYVSRTQKEQRGIFQKGTFYSYSRLDTKNRNDNLIENSSKAIKNLYLLYLCYKNFVNISKITILCEGKTDVFYLKLANKQLKQYGNDDIFYLNLGGVLEKDCNFIGGTSNLCKFIDSYDNFVEKFNIPFSFPIIIIVDRDKAGKDVLNEYEKKYVKENILTNDTTYFNQKNNLYLIVLPKFSGHNEDKIVIEHYLDKNILENGINGQKLNLTNNKTENGDLGKDRFAKLVSKNRSKYSFSNFKLIFDEIQKVEDDFSRRMRIHNIQ